MKHLTLVVLSLGTLALAAGEASAERCTRWRGTISGNDPTAWVTATLCEAGPSVRGEIVWTSRRSGRSIRTIRGAWSRGQLVVRDVEMSGRPNPGWKFCLIDRYAFRRAGDRLAGTYRSSRCRDDGSITLVRER